MGAAAHGEVDERGERGGGGREGGLCVNLSHP